MLKKKTNKSGTDKFFRKQGNILGVKITGTPKRSLLTQIDKFLSDKERIRAYFATKVDAQMGNIHDFKKDRHASNLTIQPYNNYYNPLFITTPNPEQVVLAQKDRKFKEILDFSDISLCDGMGLLVAHDFFLRKNHNKS